ncbi:MAG: hypothetical protein Kow0090_00740 [Myxococcota bacterium]
MHNKGGIVTAITAALLIPLFLGQCGDFTYPDPRQPDRTIGGVEAKDANSTIGYQVGGGNCSGGGNAAGNYCMETSEGTAILVISSNYTYDVRFSEALKDCKSRKSYANYGISLSSGAWETKNIEDEDFIIFSSGDKWAGFAYKSNYEGLSLCKPQGSPQEVGLCSGFFTRIE